MSEPITYAAAGVDVDRGNELVRVIKEIAKTTPRSGVIGEIGSFGGLFSLSTVQMEQPVLVSSADGVGTKLRVAFMMGKHDTVGIDLVAMNVNDIAVQGARPLFFLDYLAMGKLHIERAAEIVKGIAEGCRQARCALVGGETAEMPGFYGENEYELAGFAVGIVDNSRIIDGSGIRVGHRLIGMASSGLHSNGFSLARRVFFEILGMQVDRHVPEFGKTLGEELLTPTRIYSESVQRLIRDLPVHGLAHITGGGIPDKLSRVIPKACSVRIYRNSWPVPPVFRLIQEAGRIEEAEMRRTFNNGIGMIAVVPESGVADVTDCLRALGESPYLIGEIIDCRAGAGTIQWIDTGEGSACD